MLLLPQRQPGPRPRWGEPPAQPGAAVSVASDGGCGIQLAAGAAEDLQPGPVVQELLKLDC